MTGPATSRRAVLGLALASGAALAAGCGLPRQRPKAPATGTRRVRYGADDQQYADLRRPRSSPGSTPKGTVVLIHGGYWQAGYGADLMDPLAEAFTDAGYATWNVEYRRVGSGGGFPATFQDVAAAVDRLDEEDLPPACLLGHSAGGHLAAWAASRTARTPGGAPAATPTGAISLSGLLDLTAAAGAPQSGQPTISLMGGSPEEVPDRYALADPTLLVPASCPVVACQAEGERVIPTDQARRYVAAAQGAGGTATLLAVPGDHFTLIDPGSEDFGPISDAVAAAFAGR